MQTWIALFRGINVGGNNVLPMARLREILQTLGCQSVRTYIQSGNAVFESTVSKPALLSRKVRAAIQAECGFEPHVLMLSQSEMQAAIAANPYPDAEADFKSLHFFFLEKLATAPNFEALGQAKAASERYELVDRVFYLHAPDGIGRSKLAANTEKLLGVVATARNFRTVQKLMDLIAEP